MQPSRRVISVANFKQSRALRSHQKLKRPLPRICATNYTGKSDPAAMPIEWSRDLGRVYGAVHPKYFLSSPGKKGPAQAFHGVELGSQREATLLM